MIQRVFIFFLAVSLVGLIFIFLNFGRKIYFEYRLITVLQEVRLRIKLYKDSKGKYASLKTPKSDFWEVKTNPYLWLSDFDGISSPTTNSAADFFRNSVKLYDDGKIVIWPVFFQKHFFNPLSDRFDWLAEDASGTLYSANMPNSVLIASPPIQVVNVRCPLTATSPPFFEDFTKW